MTARRKVIDQEAAPAAPSLEEALQNKYRPKHLDDVYGQADVIKSIRKAMQLKTTPHSWLFTGPSGTGKTTLSRILAAGFNCGPNSIIEIDAATSTGVDAMREVLSGARYHGFGEQSNKAFIIDECHMLSKGAWNSMLKIVEEPPPHVYFFFCTTEPGKVPDTIVNRCNDYLLKPVRTDDILDLLECVCDDEKFDTPNDVLNQIGRACGGSPRAALKMLSKVYDITDREESARVLETPLDNEEIIDLCRRLVKGGMKWTDVTAGLKALGETNAESIRIPIVNYLNACLMGATTHKQAGRLADMLHAFTRPCNPSDKLAPVLLAFSEFVLQE